MSDEPTVKELVYSCPVDHSGTTITINGWQVVGSKKAPIVITHDIGENYERYIPLIRALNEGGYSAYCFDFRLNPNPRDGVVPKFSTFVKELLQIIAWVKHKEEGRRPIILGRGMGALISLYLTKAHGKFISGMIFASPMFNLTDKLTPMRRLMIKTIAEITPGLKLPSWLSPTFTNSNQETYIAIPGKHSPKVQSSFAFELLNSIDQSKKLIKRINVPCLFICPENDPSLQYEFLKPLVQRHPNPGLFVLKYVKGEDNLPLEPGGTTLKYLSNTVLGWADENIEKPHVEVNKEEEKPDSKTPTIIIEPVVAKDDRE